MDTLENIGLYHILMIITVVLIGIAIIFFSKERERASLQILEMENRSLMRSSLIQSKKQVISMIHIKIYSILLSMHGRGIWDIVDSMMRLQHP